MHTNPKLPPFPYRLVESYETEALRPRGEVVTLDARIVDGAKS